MRSAPVDALSPGLVPSGSALHPATASPDPYRRDAGIFLPCLALAPSPVFAGVLWLIALASLGSAIQSFLPWPLKSAMLCAVFLLLLQAWLVEKRAGVRHLACVDSEPPRLRLLHADGRVTEDLYSGYALLGSLAIFLFIERRGWRRLLGPRRITVLRDATDADGFRRLRAWVRLS